MSQPSNPDFALVRRVLMPLFVVAVPIAAMIAFVLYYHRQAPPKEPSSNVPTVSFGSSDWPITRGDAGLTGNAVGILPASLKLKWRFQTGGPIKAAPVAAKGVVFAASADKHLYAMDASQGSLIWKFQADSELEAGPLWDDGRIFIGSANGLFYALSASDGKLLWKFEAGGRIAGAANIAVLASGQRLVVFGSYDNTLYALDAQSGTSIRQHKAGSYINGSPAIAGQTAVFGSCDGFVHCVPLDGTEAKSIDAGSYVAASPAVFNSIMYVGSYEGVFTAADIAAGAVLWRHSSQKDDPFLSSPAVNETYVIAGCRDHKLYAFNRADGALAWTFEAADDFDSSPVICGDKVIVGNNDGRLYMVDLAARKQLFSYTLGSPIVSSPAVAQNSVYIGCDNGLLFAFTANTD